MKGILVFNAKNDIVFIWADSAFRNHVNSQALESGLIQATDLHKPINLDAAVQIFSSIINSQNFMVAHTKNPYASIKLENGLIFVIKRFHGQVHMVVNGDGKESEEFLDRKLYVLQQLIFFFYGPVVEEIKPRQIAEREKRWKFISSLLLTWSKLYRSEQCFRVEAVERLRVTQDLNFKALELLEQALTKIRSSGDRHVHHALLLVKSKLLALFSSRNAFELQSSDILLITLMIQDLFPTKDTLEDLLSISVRHRTSSLTDSPTTDYRGEKAKGSTDEGDDEDSGSLDEEYYSVDSIDEDRPHDPEHRAGQQVDRSPNEGFSTPRASFEIPEDFKAEKAESSGSKQSSPESIGSSERLELFQKSVFLQAPNCRTLPHYLHCLEIAPGLVLVVVSEVTRGRLAIILCQILHTLNMFLTESAGSKDQSHGRYRLEVMEGNLKKITDAIRKLKGQGERLARDIHNRWDKVKQQGLLTWLEQAKLEELPVGLESCLDDLRVCLLDLFRRLYLNGPHMTDETHGQLVSALWRLQIHFQNKLLDYRDFLVVKAQRNITMTSYIEDYPGLVHFIYIDRTSNTLVAPSLSLLNKDDKMDATNMIKEKIWQMVDWVQSKLTQGYVSMSKREGDFTYSYFLWFEDVSGSPLVIQQPFQPYKVNIPPGVIAGNFYKEMIKTCFPNFVPRSVHCYEVMTVHVGLVPTDLVLKHCRKLAASLWEASGDINTALSLL
ncbi:BLOC-3 complex member HPS1-like [Lineus longissimus]|uniref:BLOC-3 complex member HPS1-like n=1 Tax=Lineus longissimus TaxID=88925 RepID=UPI002B4CFA74